MEEPWGREGAAGEGMDAVVDSFGRGIEHQASFLVRQNVCLKTLGMLQSLDQPR